MQSSNEDEKKRDPSVKDTELSETWRALLGLRSAEHQEELGELEALEELDDLEGKVLEVDLAAQVQPLPDDPWSHLLHAQGMQAVDLQKVHLRDLDLAAGDEDVEHALNLMRESTGQLRAINERPEEKNA